MIYRKLLSSTSEVQIHSGHLPICNVLKYGLHHSIREIELKTRTHYAIRAIKESGEINVAHVAKMLGLKSGTFAKQLRENEEFQKCLEKYQEGRKLLARLK